MEGLSFFVWGGAVVMFMRLRRRWLKGTVLMVTGVLSLLLVAHYAGSELELGAYVVLNVLMLGLFLTPALMEKKWAAEHLGEVP